MKIKVLIFCLFSISVSLSAQADRWQQRAVYSMDIDFDVKKHQFEGTQKLIYINNSPDELNKVFYHLYFNAFQPNSMMDLRNQYLPDSDPRIKERIKSLKPDEMGYLKIKSLTYNGQAVSFKEVGTILEVTLSEPIPPNSTAIFDMTFDGQVPVQIRRSGRNNAEGVDYSMAQWYPKMCEYDYQGWHANPYIGREFYGVWGDFDVTIHIDKDYMVASTGYLQNPEEIGKGYETKGMKVKKPSGKKLSWRFFAPNVHDFVWAADPDYTHVSRQSADGPMMHFFYQKIDDNEEAWDKLPEVMDHVFTYANKHFGKYPYEVYSFIQGGDGGMEYPMATLITGNRSFPSLVGVSVHELMHSWYQMVLGTNESLYAWMDEGFTSYSSAAISNHLKEIGAMGGMKPVERIYESTYGGYANFAKSGYEEPLSVHADHFMTNGAYGVGAYVKGQVWLHQLEYIIGKDAFTKGLLNYYNTWKFKHPNVNDFVRIMEKESGLELDWYKEYWVNTTHKIDYGVGKVEKEGRKKTKITLKKVGVMPMPLDVVVTYKKGNKKEVINIPLRMMRGEKKRESMEMEYKTAEDWPWTHGTYELILPVKMKKIMKIEIDPDVRMADVDRSNNVWEKGDKEEDVEAKDD